MDSPLRLITTEVAPAAELARTLEALLVVASQPLPVSELAAAAECEPAQIEEALELLKERFAEEAQRDRHRARRRRLGVPRLR